MLFSSNVFLFLFLPLTLVGFQFASHFGRNALFTWLALTSLMFYAYWNPIYVLLLLGSITVNYLFSIAIARYNGSTRTRLIITAIAVNLSLLIWFKYLFPILNYFHGIGWTRHAFAGVVLPLGISFFTFTQIAYLIDLSQGVTPRQDLLSYILFVTFFPHLIAGPIIHHIEMMPQFSGERRGGLHSGDLSVGITWFLLGLGKKVLIADRLGPMADALYAQPHGFGFVGTWVGLLSYAFQLYFDFSGYSDMAIGLARMFSISFPVNFNSPYKATSIIDFWQRWHMTLSRYLGVYVYNPIALFMTRRRTSPEKQASIRAIKTAEGFAQMVASPLLLTMLVAGVWHGAGLQFIFFGAAHGLFLVVNHGFRIFVPQKSPLRKFLPAPMGVLLTFGCVLTGQVFFRATSASDAFYVFGTLIGARGRGPALGESPFPGEVPTYSQFLLSPYAAIATFVFCFFVVWALPNTQEILNQQLEKGIRQKSSIVPQLRWKPNLVWATGLCIILFASLMLISDGTSFLYFQF